MDELASEVRFLEDQLYQVDYENKVLREKLARLKRLESDSSKTSDRSLFGNRKSIDRKDRDRLETTPRVDEREEIETPEIRLGEPEISAPGIQIPDANLLPEIEPGDIAPPNDSGLVPPQIDTGDIIPPGGLDAAAKKEQVAIPANLKRLYREPPGPLASLKIDPVRSKSHNFDSEGDDDGVYLLVQGFDARGTPVAVDRAIEVAILDPARDPSEARLGVWTIEPQLFSPATETRETADGILVPVRWLERRPMSQSIHVFCRLDVDGRQIQTDSKLSLHGPVTQLWTPRP